MKMFLGLSLMSFVFSAAWRSDALTKDDGPFKVEIAVNSASLQEELYKSQHIFFVDTKVTNVSHREQKLVAWTQYGWSWISSSAQVRPGIEATKNSPARIVLQPGQSYARAVEMFSMTHRPVTFKLGFAPQAQRPISGQANSAAVGELFWSNLVTLTR